MLALEEAELDVRLPLFIYLSIFCLCVCLYACLSVCLSVCLFIFLCLFICLCLFVCLCLFICLSVCLSVCFFICLCLSVSVCLSFLGKRQNTSTHSNFHQPRLPPSQWQCLPSIRLIAHTVAKILRHAGPCPRGIAVKTKGSMP